jgi:hypothetical protein
MKTVISLERRAKNRSFNSNPVIFFFLILLNNEYNYKIMEGIQLKKTLVRERMEKECIN